MILMSHLRRRLAVAILALSSLSCSLLGHQCKAIGCLEGLNILLTGGFDPDKTYTIDLSRLTSTGAAVPVMSCARTWPSTSGALMDCTSSLRFQADPYRIQIFDQSITRLRVAISVDGAIVNQKDYDVAFSSREINGEGCGWCTSASVNVDFPVRPVWGAQGQSIRAGSCGDDAVGAISFTATRDQLSPEQLRLLSEMQAVPDPAPSCPTGQTQCFVEVVYYDNFVADWYARTSDGTCTDIPDRPEKLISFATFEPFRQTLGCWYSRQLTAAATEAASGNGPLPALVPSAICQHGITATAGTTTSIGLDVPADATTGPAPTRHIELHNCNPSVGSGPIELQLYDPTGTTLLAPGTNPNDPTSAICQVIDYTFSAPGTYVLKVIASPTYFSGTVFISYQ